MNTTTTPTPETKQKTLTLTRIFDAPRELVFKAWTDPKLMTEWWGPHGFTNTGCKLDPKAGGIFQICMNAPKFPDHWTKGTFLEVIKPEKIVFSANAFTPDSPDTPAIEITNIVTFEEYKGKTKLTLHAIVTRYKPEFQFGIDGMETGWSQSLEKLTTLLSTLVKK